MATKTITLELDAYKRLKSAKRDKESFSSVVRRARFDPEPSSGAALLEETAAFYAANKGISHRALDYFDKSLSEKPRISRSHWERE